MTDWMTLFGIVQSVAAARGASKRQHESVARDLGEWWRNGGKETAASWSEAEARRWAESHVRVS